MITDSLPIDQFTYLRALELFAKPSNYNKPFTEKVARVALAIIATIPALIADTLFYAATKIYTYTLPINDLEELDQSIDFRALPQYSFEAPVPSAPPMPDENCAPSAPDLQPDEPHEICFARDVAFIRKAFEKALCPSASHILMSILDAPRIGQPETKLAAEMTLLAYMYNFATTPNPPPYFIDLDTPIEGESVRELAHKASTFDANEWRSLAQALYEPSTASDLSTNVGSFYREFTKHAEALSRSESFLNTLTALKRDQALTKGHEIGIL
jgi:hypothetical protein